MRLPHLVLSLALLVSSAVPTQAKVVYNNDTED